MACNIIWIGPNIENDQINFIEELKTNNFGKIEQFKEIGNAIQKLSNINFEETKIIIIDNLYSEFVKRFKESINDMKVIPKIIIFTKNEKKFIKDNKESINEDNKFYTNGGIATTFENIKELLKDDIDFNDLNIPDEVQLTFECIKKKEQLVLPMFFKALIELASKDNMENFIKYVYDTYSAKDPQIKNLLRFIRSMKNIPIELLSKYYIRLYTLASDFHKNMNKDLGLNNVEKYLPFITTLYEGVKLKALELTESKELYRGTKISNKEIKNIKDYLGHKKEGLPGSIVFSKSFLSFSKNKDIALHFLNQDNNVYENLSKVLFILEKDDNLEYSLLTHADIEKLSIFPHEEEVLFFPFSSFEIKKIEEKYIKGEKRYEIILLYLGKYLKEIENDKNITENKNNLINSEIESVFNKEIVKSGLIPKKTIENINSENLHKKFIDYKNKIKKNDVKSNKIIGEIYIGEKDINEEILIINSFENVRKEYKFKKEKIDKDFENENEIKNVEIKINGEKINEKLQYKYIFKKEGKYKIEYIFKNEIKNINHLFYTCDRLTNLDLSHLNTENVIHMNYMFYNCKSLKKVDLSNFDTKKVTHMNNMFFGCSSLKTLKLSSFITENVINMKGLFWNCSSITELDLSNLDTSKVKNMSNMFNKCECLTSLNLSNFDTKNVEDMSSMFNNCKNLINLDLSNFDTKNVENMNSMFSGCVSLQNLKFRNLNTQNVTDMDNMFYGCSSMKNFNLLNLGIKNE